MIELFITQPCLANVALGLVLLNVPTGLFGKKISNVIITLFNGLIE